MKAGKEIGCPGGLVAARQDRDAHSLSGLFMGKVGVCALVTSAPESY